ncbi:hypothetical protein HX021_15110 [Sphingobacterium sp. N143]|nr:hypothetical protein [Sphingobacterium sp. N143]MDM1295619.1 hypothetical protein [Sphingobacterium sp. N143]
MNKKLAIKKKTVFKMKNKNLSELGDGQTGGMTGTVTQGLTFSSLL